MAPAVNVSAPSAPRGYPWRKVVFVGEYAEVAEFPCENAGDENIVFHADLLARLVEAHPELGPTPKFTAGWLMESQGEATLYLAGVGEVSTELAESFASALSEWCEGAGISTLTITDTTRTFGTEKASDDDWKDWFLPS